MHNEQFQKQKQLQKIEQISYLSKQRWLSKNDLSGIFLFFKVQTGVRIGDSWRNLIAFAQKQSGQN